MRRNRSFSVSLQVVTAVRAAPIGIRASPEPRSATVLRSSCGATRVQLSDFGKIHRALIWCVSARLRAVALVHGFIDGIWHSLPRLGLTPTRLRQTQRASRQAVCRSLPVLERPGCGGTEAAVGIAGRLRAVVCRNRPGGRHGAEHAFSANLAEYARASGPRVAALADLPQLHCRVDPRVATPLLFSLLSCCSSSASASQPHTRQARAQGHHAEDQHG